MPGRVKSKREKRVDNELEMRILDILYHATEYDNPTLDWIKNQDMIVGQYSTQKLSHIIGFLISMGLVKKGKSKSLGRMVYRSVSRMYEDGYEEEDPLENVTVPEPKMYNGREWDLEEEMRGNV